MLFYIDEAVVRAACKHMRKTCGDSMDRLKGDNYNVGIIFNCIKVPLQESAPKSFLHYFILLTNKEYENLHILCMQRFL